MKEINEVIDLPSIEEKPWLHPLDVAPARRPYLISWWLRRLASLPVAFLFGTLLWMISNNVVTPMVVPLIVLATAALAAEYYAGQAWEHIPRKRQDRDREAAALPQLGIAFIETLALMSGLLFLIAWVSTQTFVDGVEEVTIGIGAGIALIQLTESVAMMLRPRRNWTGIAPKLLALAAMVLAVLVASTTLVTDPWSTDSIRLALMGAVTMIAIQLILWLILFIGQRRSTTEQAD